MSNTWYEDKHIKEQLIVFGRAIQGVSPFEIVIEHDPEKCRSAYCNFTARRIGVNPCLFTVTPREQYELTKALLVHEAGHKRFTVPRKLPTLIREVSNVLEDERVDRLMCKQFAGVGWMMRKLAAAFLDKAEMLDDKSNSPDDVVRYCLQLRWAVRSGKAVKGSLSAKNRERWNMIKPFVHDSWEAASSQVVDLNAAHIVDILGLAELLPETLTDQQFNNRKEFDEAKTTYPLVRGQATNGQ